MSTCMKKASGPPKWKKSGPEANQKKVKESYFYWRSFKNQLSPSLASWKILPTVGEAAHKLYPHRSAPL